MLDGRTALISGSTGWDMGATIALALASKGVNVILNFSPHRVVMSENLNAKLQGLREKIETIGTRAILIETDTRFLDEIKKTLEENISRKLTIDILVNNGGGGWSGQDIKKGDFQKYQRAFSAETRSATNCIAACLPSMRDKRWGRIVNIGFARVLELMSRVMDEPFMPGAISHVSDLAYESKYEIFQRHGIAEWILEKDGNVMLHRSRMRDEQRNNVTVNTISLGPGWVERWEEIYSPLEGYHMPHSEEDDWNGVRRETPILQTVAAIVLFLCTEQAKFITGSDISIQYME